jgi:type I restriction enzyme S subunit
VWVISNLNQKFDIQRLSKIDLSKMPTDDYFLENGDIVFVRSNGNRELVGRSIEIFPNKEKVVYSD